MNNNNPILAVDSFDISTKKYEPVGGKNYNSYSVDITLKAEKDGESREVVSVRLSEQDALLFAAKLDEVVRNIPR